MNTPMHENKFLNEIIKKMSTFGNVNVNTEFDLILDHVNMVLISIERVEICSRFTCNFWAKRINCLLFEQSK